MTATSPTPNEALLTRILSLTQELILIPSTACRPKDRSRCFHIVRNRLEQVPHIRVTEFESGGYQSLVALPEGIDQPDILLCAHLDVIAHPHEEAYEFRRIGDRLQGPGAGDMKGALAVLIELLTSLQREHPGLSIGLAVTSDEEIGGEHGIRYLFDEVGLRCGSALIPDGGSLNRVTVEEKGILHVRMHAESHPGHAARPWSTGNPLDRLVDGLSRLRGYFKDLADPSDASHWYPTATPTIVQTSNTTVNRIPGRAEAVLDIRFPPPHSSKEMIAVVGDLVGDLLEVHPIIAAEPTHLAPDPLFIKTTEEITGNPVTTTRESGGSDARFICAYGIPVMMSRPLVGNLHAEDEWINIPSMLLYHQICRKYILGKLA